MNSKCLIIFLICFELSISENINDISDDDFDEENEKGVENKYNNNEKSLDLNCDQSCECDTTVSKTCSLDYFIDNLTNPTSSTPDDYEGENGQKSYQNISRYDENINKTFDRIDRFANFFERVSQKFSPFTKQLRQRISELLMTADLETECITSLVRISSGIKSGKLWALKCELNFYLFSFSKFFSLKIFKLSILPVVYLLVF
jgi:hypothetical protein